uniref:N-acetylmuramoyl-L-alanine amidase family protein n=1 Tax=Streptococcus tangpeifui TaxID=2709400 RepID=UPI003F4C4A10
YGHVFIDDKTGQKVSGVQYINGEEYHFSRLYYNNFLVKIGKDGKAYDYRGELLTPGLKLDDVSANVDPILINKDNTLARHTLYWGSINYHPLRPHLGDIKTGYLYFDQEGYAVRDKLITVDGKTYYFSQDGFAITNSSQTIDGKTYYFNEDGNPITSQYKEIGGNWYYFNKEGHMLTGWQTIDNTQRYFDKDGVQAKNGDYTIDGTLYHFDADGNPSSGKQNEEHPSITGHFEMSSNGYGHVFIDDKTGQKVSGVQYINGEEYHFSRLYYNNFLVKIGKDGKAYDYRGELLTPGLKLDDVSANVDPILINDDHTLARNKLYWGSINYHPLRPHLGDIKTGYLYFDQEGYAIREKLVTVDGKTYYFGQDGFAITNSSQTIDGKTYYFNEDGNPITSQYKEIGGNWYYFDREAGQALTGWQTIDNTQRYFDKDGVQAKDGDYTIDGTLYHFDADGNPSRID